MNDFFGNFNDDNFFSDFDNEFNQALQGNFGCQTQQLQPQPMMNQMNPMMNPYQQPMMNPMMNPMYQQQMMMPSMMPYQQPMMPMSSSSLFKYGDDYGSFISAGPNGVTINLTPQTVFNTVKTWQENAEIMREMRNNRHKK